MKDLIITGFVIYHMAKYMQNENIISMQQIVIWLGVFLVACFLLWLEEDREQEPEVKIETEQKLYRVK